MAAGRFSVEAVFKTLDNISKPVKTMTRNTVAAIGGLTTKLKNSFRRMTQSSGRFAKAIRKDFAKAQRSVDKFARNAKEKIGRGFKRAVQIGVGGLVVGLSLAAIEFVTFDKAITNSVAKFKDVEQGTEAAAQSMKDLRKVARDVGAITEFSATEAGQGLDFLAMAGFRSKQAIALLPKVVDLATVAGTDLARATDIASDALGAFGLMTEDTEQLTLNLARVNDVAAKTTTSFNTDLETLFESIKKGAPAFTAAGQKMETFNALVGAMANSGVKGAESGTQLRNVMLRLSKPTSAAEIVLSKLAVKTQDASGNFKDIIDILADFEKGLKGMGTAQKTAALATVFGARSVTGINVLLSEGTDKLRQYRQQLLSAKDAAFIMSETIRKSLFNRIATLKSAAIELGFKFIEAFEKQGGSAIDSLTEAIRKFDPKPIISGIKTIASIFIILFKIVKPFLPLIISLVLAWKTYVTVLKISAAAQLLFNTIMAANPIALVILAIAALVGIIIIIINNWDTLVKFFVATGKVIANVFDTIWEGLKIGFTVAIAVIEKVFFTFADLFLSVWGTIIQGILFAAEKVGGTIGLNVEKVKGIRESIGSIQATVSEKSALSDIRRVITPGERISKSIEERNSTQEVRIMNNSNNKVETKNGEIGTGSSIMLPATG